MGKDDPRNQDPDKTHNSDIDGTLTSDSERTLAHSHSASKSKLPKVSGYKILNRLGEGGMGIVYAAEQQNPRRKVALKVIRGGHAIDDSMVRMFRREAETLARLKHPNIGGIYESGRTEDGRPFFAMEIVTGQTLDQFCSKEVPSKKLSPNEINRRLRLFYKIADAVHYAHQRGVIHRDIKPSNIVVLEEDTTSSGSRADVPGVKILDFGLARITDTDVHITQVTEVGVIKGTLAYMSPEQARGNPDNIDVRSDVYSLGVVLYQMLSGKLPRDIPGSMVKAIQVITNQSAKSLQDTYQGSRRIDSDVVTICHKALELDPNDRYASAAALAEDIERYLSHQPIMARRPSASYHIKKLVMRHKLPSAFAATVLILLIGSLIVMNSLRSQAETARIEAQQRADELEKVTKFQTSMLSDLDTDGIGLALFDDINSRIAKSLELDQLAAEEATKLLAVFDSMLHRANATDVALTLLDKDILVRATKAADEQFYDEPVLRATLLHTIASTYRELGLFHESLSLHKVALSLRRDVLGADDVQTLTSLAHLGVVAEDLFQMDDAFAYNKEAYERRLQVLGEDHEHTIYSLGNLAGILGRMGQIEEAAKYTNEFLEKCQKHLGEDHRSTIYAIELIAGHHYAKGEYNQALDKFYDVLNKRRALLGDDNAYTLRVSNQISDILTNQGNYEEALPFLEEALELSKRTFGNNHTGTLAIQSRVAIALTNLGRLDEVRSILYDTYEGYRRVVGDEHPEALNAMTNLGIYYQKVGDYDSARHYLGTVLEQERKILGEQHDNTLVSMINLAIMFRTIGDLNQSIKLSNEAVGNSRKLYGNKHLRTIVALRTLGVSYQFDGNATKAKSCMREALELSKETFGEDHNTTRITKSDLSGTLREFGEYEEALSLNEEVLNHPLTSDSLNSISLALTMENRANILRLMGRSDEALSFQMDALDLKSQLMDKPNSSIVISFNETGLMLSNAGRSEEAIEYYQKGLELAYEILGDSHPTTITMLGNIAIDLQRLDKMDEALSIYEKAIRLSKEVFGEDHSKTLLVSANLGGAYQTLNRLDEAYSICNWALVGFENTYGIEHIYTQNTLMKLASIMVDMDSLDQVIELLAPNEAYARNVFVNDHGFRLGGFLSALGRAELGKGEIVNAEMHLLEAYELIESSDRKLQQLKENLYQALVELYILKHTKNPGQGFDSKSFEWKRKLEMLKSGKSDSI